MATRISPNRRRSRSSSAPTSPVLLGGPDDPRTKRAHPLGPGSVPSPCKWEDVEMWRRGKRARRDMSIILNNLDSQPLGFLRDSFSLQDDSSSTPAASVPPTPFFATTSAEFNLFPKHKRTQSSSDWSHAQPDPPLPFIEDIDLDTKIDLIRLRSDAFWELRRSVAESGEGLVRRMRDYESSRSRGGVYSKVKDSLRRGRKRHSLSIRPRRVVVADGYGPEDEVEIFSGDRSSEADDSGGARKKRAFSLGTADSGVHDSPFMDLDGSERCSSPGAARFSAPSAYDSDEENMDLIDDSPLSTSVIGSSPGVPALSRSFTSSTNSSFVSLPGPALGIHTKSSPSGHHFFRPTSPSSSRSEKAIAALSLAMANGAGGLNDYAVLRTLETQPIIEDCQVGELWH